MLCRKSVIPFSQSTWNTAWWIKTDSFLPSSSSYEGIDLNLLYLIQIALTCVSFHLISLNHLNSFLADFRKVLTVASTLSHAVERIMSSASLAMPISFKIRKRSLRNMLNKIGLNTKPWGTQKIICFQKLEDSLIFVLWKSYKSSQKKYMHFVLGSLQELH